MERLWLPEAAGSPDGGAHSLSRLCLCLSHSTWVWFVVTRRVRKRTSASVLAWFPSGVLLSFTWISGKHGLEKLIKNLSLSLPLEKVQKRHKTNFLCRFPSPLVGVSILCIWTLCNRRFRDSRLFWMKHFSHLSKVLVTGWEKGTMRCFFILWLTPHSAKVGRWKERKIELIFLHSGEKGHSL